VDRAGRVARLVRGEVHDQRGDLLGAAQAPDRLARDERGQRLLRIEGVSTVPGQIALQRMPWPTKSAETDFVRPITAALVAP
jgi:hypothetical protein